MNRLVSHIALFMFGLVSLHLTAADVPVGAKVVAYGDKEVVAIKAKVRFTTLIVLPKSEQILDYACGDKEFWVVNGNQNFAYIKPAKAGAQTNLNLIAASGNVYSFFLTEVSSASDSQPDLKIFIEPKDESMLSAANGQPRFVPAQQIEDYRAQVEIAKAEARDARQSAQTAIEQETGKIRAEYPARLKFVYRIEADKKPFNVAAMYHDGKFTYIQAHPDEPPVIYEVRDGKPGLIQFEFHDGVYVAGKVLDSGYLAIGKQKLAFTRTESADK